MTSKTTKTSHHAGTFKLHEPKTEHLVSLTHHTVTTHIPPERVEGADLNQEQDMATSTASTRNRDLRWLLLVAFAVVLSFAAAYAIWGQGTNNAPPPSDKQSSAPVQHDNWTPPVEPEGVVRHAHEVPPTLRGANDLKGQPFCDKYDHGKAFKGWVGLGKQRHAFCV